jgi:alanine racemase
VTGQTQALQRLNDNPLRRCWAEIDLSALNTNLEAIRQHQGHGASLMAIVKADAYGHGLEKVVTAIAPRVRAFGVANTSEALRITESIGSEHRILILSPLTPDEVETVLVRGFSSSASLRSEVLSIGEMAKSLKTVARLHAVVDTGMGRMGSRPDQWSDLVRTIMDHPHCHLEGICTHFPNADEDSDFTIRQIDLFRSLFEDLDISVSELEIHLSNSAGIIDFSNRTGFASMVRPGIAMYGISPECQSGILLKPALSLKSRITLVRKILAGTTISYGSTYVSREPMTVASVAAGYGDGYPRHLSGRGADVLVCGVRCPVLGRITMDQIVIDISHLPAVRSGEEVVLIGSQADECIPATEIASKAGTIPWEILTGITSRVERVYFD